MRTVKFQRLIKPWLLASRPAHAGPLLFATAVLPVLAFAGPPGIDKPLLAHWAFDGRHATTCVDSGGGGNEAMLAGGKRLRRTIGLFGDALSLSGSHQIAIPGKPDFRTLDGIGFSAWVLPGSFDRYNEIFRKEDGEHRVLFSFQEQGTILALGMNVDGYIECDAAIKPEEVLDGLWHHCAATFDGEFMRVYLDGREIGSRKRPGTITAGGGAPGCIGSLNGGECFQGLLDELRIYGAPLTAEEVAALFREGRQAIPGYREKRLRQFLADKEKLRSLNITGKTFAEMLSRAKEGIVAKKINLSDSMASEIVELLQTAFPEDSRDFARFTGMNLADHLATADGSANAAITERMLGLLTEYMPLTDDQWKLQGEGDQKKWKEVAAIQDRFRQLDAQGTSASPSPEWIALVLEAGRRNDLVDERPRRQEAVAPYVKPSTPETRSLTTAEARSALERDWMHQAGSPTPERIREEIKWTRELAARIKVDCGPELAALDALEQKAAAAKTPDQALYFQVREIKRRILFRNPVVDFDQVLFVDMPYPAGNEWRHETRHRLGYMAVPGGRLLVLDGLRPGGSLRQLMPQAPLHGSFWRPDVSPDAQKVLFCFKPHNEKSFHLYEIDIDGTGLRQLTRGPYDDLDPIYLPDRKHILFSTTRGHTYVRCMPPTNAYVLARCDRDGNDLYLVSRNNEPDYLPSVMNDGRVIYTRWEYTDKPLWRAQGLWTLNPDGTQVETFWGNQSVWPDLLKDARSIPGSRRVMFTGSAHHDWFSGSVGIIEPGQGFNFPDGLTKVTADVPWPESDNGPVDPVESTRYHRSGRYVAYYSPYPLGEQDFLVSANRDGKFRLYLMDVDGNRELIYEGRHNVFHALPLKKRPRPPVRPDLVAWPREGEKTKDGVIYSNNVYEGVPDKLKGRASFLRVLSIDHKTYTYWHKRPYLSTGPVVSGVQSEGVKRILGTVPLEKDGSVAFFAPPGIPLHFQLLDDQFRALQTMRSFTGVMPGETRGCVGCHERHSGAPENLSKSLALASEPHAITPPPWGEDTVSYARYVRPLLDKYCSECHEGDHEGRKALDTTPRPGRLGFDETYWLFTGQPSWGSAYQQPENPPPGFGIADMIMIEGYERRDPAAYRTPEPMTRLSFKSRLLELASGGKHYDVRVDPLSRRKLIAWIDAMCPYRGDEEVREIDDPDFQGIDWLAIRPKIRNAPRIARPGPVGVDNKRH